MHFNLPDPHQPPAAGSKKIENIHGAILQTLDCEVRLISRAKQISISFRIRLVNRWWTPLFALEFAATFCLSLIKQFRVSSK